MWAEDGRADAEGLRRLVAEGVEKGFLSYDEIAAALEEVELTKKQIDDLYAQLVDRSIELVEGERHKYPPQEQPALAEDDIKAAGARSPDTRGDLRCYEGVDPGSKERA